MNKIFELLKKYLAISILLSIFSVIFLICSSIKNRTLPTVNLIFIVKNILIIFPMALIFTPGIAFIDLLIIKAAKALFDDYKESDKTGKIIIIVVAIMLLLRKILILTR